MQQKVLDQAAFVLHAQPFSNTSLLVDVFTQEYGRFRVVAKGVRSAKSPRRALLQIFTPIKISWSGKSDLKTLTDIELNLERPQFKLQGNALFNGMYVNELLIKFLFAFDQHAEVFDIYSDWLHEMSQCKGLENESAFQEFLLRNIEYQLLENLGFGLGIESIFSETEPDIFLDTIYEYHPELGLRISNSVNNALPQVTGRYLMALFDKNICDKQGLQELKTLMRFVLHQQLEGKGIQSRMLYQK